MIMKVHLSGLSKQTDSERHPLSLSVRPSIVELCSVNPSGLPEAGAILFFRFHMVRFQQMVGSSYKPTVATYMWVSVPT